jgi:hypothetical protein
VSWSQYLKTFYFLCLKTVVSPTITQSDSWVQISKLNSCLVGFYCILWWLALWIQKYIYKNSQTEYSLLIRLFWGIGDKHAFHLVPHLMWYIPPLHFQFLVRSVDYRAI